VLTAYALRNAEIGYCQSMNFIAALLLIVLEHDEEQAFWMLSVIEERIVPDYHGPGILGCQADTRSFMDYIENFLPAIGAKLVDFNIIPDVAFISWFMTLFTT